MPEFISIMFWPFMACLILVGIHAYFGFHIIERGVIFADLALAQVAALGTGIALIYGFHLDSPQSYWFSLAFTLIGAAVFAFTRLRSQIIPQEALIGIVYVVAAALLVLILSRSGEGTEHIHEMLVGNILLVTPGEVLKMLAIYAAVGLLHMIFYRQFWAVTRNHHAENARWWDFLFYVTFGIVVTSSVKIAGVLLVFSFLVIPAVCAMLFSQKPAVRLALGWVIGSFASLIGMGCSYYADYPTGAATVVVFGGALILSSVVSVGQRLGRR